MLHSNRSIIKFLSPSFKTALMIALNGIFWVCSLCSRHMIDSAMSFWARKRASQKQKVAQRAKRCWVVLASTATCWKCVASSVTQHNLWDGHTLEHQSKPRVVIYRNNRAISMLRLWKRSRWRTSGHWTCRKLHRPLTEHFITGWMKKLMEAHHLQSAKRLTCFFSLFFENKWSV